MLYNIYSGAIRLQISASLRHIMHFALALDVSEILTFQNVTLKIQVKVNVRSGVIRWQISNSKRLPSRIFVLAVTCLGN